MNDATPVRMQNRLRQLFDQDCCSSDVRLVLLGPAMQGLALDILHDQRWRIIDQDDFQRMDDVWMVDLG